LRRRGLRYGYGFLRGEPGYRYLRLRVLLREELRSSLQVRLPFGRPRGLRSSGGFRVRSFRGLLELSELLQGVSFLITGFKVSLLELVKLLRRSLRASASASARLPPAHSFVHCEGEDKSDGFPVTSQPIRLLRYPGLRLPLRPRRRAYPSTSARSRSPRTRPRSSRLLADRGGPLNDPAYSSGLPRRSFAARLPRCEPRLSQPGSSP